MYSILLRLFCFVDVSVLMLLIVFDSSVIVVLFLLVVCDSMLSSVRLDSVLIDVIV